MSENHLPFKTGQSVEARSFQQGYRGAWFRCKIEEIDWKRGEMFHFLKYMDFPDEKLHRTKLYQKPLHGPKNLRDKQLMVRPEYPPVCQESQASDIAEISEVIVVINDDWKVGDMVDWWSDGCYWSGKIAGLLEDKKVRLELFPPPTGEGLIYEASCHDLRPSLDWSLDNGWTVPASEDYERGYCSAQVIKRVNEGDSTNLIGKTVREGEGKKKNQPKSPASVDQKASFSPEISSPKTASKRNRDTLAEVKKPTSSISVLGSHVRDAMVEVAEATGKIEEDKGSDSKNNRADGGIMLNSMMSDTIEAAVLDLEELINRVKWMKSLLNSGTPSSDSARLSWKFLEHRASSTPRFSD